MAKNEKPASTEDLQKQLEEAQAAAAAAQEENAALKAQLEKTDPAPLNAVVVAKNGLNIRSGPSKAFDSRAILPHGTAVEILILPCFETVPGWSLIRTEGVIGWAMNDFLEGV